MKVKSFCSVVWLILIASAAFAQTTAFTYQGKLTDVGNPANGNYDLQFRLFDTSTVGTGTQAGATLVRNPVVVSAGIFTVTLDFGANVFSGADRFLEIGVRPQGSANPYTTLAPRQPITSSPYAIQTLNAQQLGGLPASGFVQNTSTPQAGANFNIGGAGTVGSLNINNLLAFVSSAPPAVAPAGQGRLYFDSATNKFKVSESGGAYVNLVGATGVSGSGTANVLALWSAGTTLGNSVITQSVTGNIGIGAGTPAHRLAVLGGPCWTGDCWGGALELDNATAIGWRQNTAGLKFGIGHTEAGLFFFRTSSPLGSTANGPMYDFKLDNNGNAGFGNLGINTDLSGAKLIVQTTGYGLAQTDGTVTLSSYIGASAGWLGTKSNHPLHFYTNDGSPLMTLLTNGNVGIGTTTPLNKLRVEQPISGGAAIYGENTFVGVTGSSTGVAGRSVNGNGQGTGGDFVGGFTGVRGLANTGNFAGPAYGVFGDILGGGGPRYAVYGRAFVSPGTPTAYGVYGTAAGAATNWAGYFDGNTLVNGNLQVFGTLSKSSGAFKIDHPLDPTNKYLLHSFVESPDMKNLYDGVVTTDETGVAVVTLPVWFAALNRDFRYQLTVIGQFAQAIIVEEIKDNQFKLATDKPRVKVSWQVTGIRQDQYAEDNRIKVEEDKRPEEQGKCLYAPLCQDTGRTPGTHDRAEETTRRKP